MCGRYAIVDGERIYLRWPHVDWHETRIQPRFNIAPQQLIPTVRMADGQARAEMMVWGYRPSWMRPGKLPPPINAKAESLVEKPMWRSALQRYRCLVPATGFYEWRSVAGQKTKQPMHIRLRDGTPFAFAGLWTLDADGVPTVAIVTTGANELMAGIHTRMPVILDPEDETTWLDPERRDPSELMALLQAYPAEAMEAYPVSQAVGNVRSEGPQLADPLDS